MLDYMEEMNVYVWHVKLQVTSISFTTLRGPCFQKKENIVVLSLKKVDRKNLFKTII